TETGLQIYKFGKITSMPNFEAESFIDIVKENLSINAHSLILIDIGLKFEDVLDRLTNLIRKHKLKIDKLIVCSKLGSKDSLIKYETINEIKSLKKVQAPFCIIVPGKLHFLEEEYLKRFG
ncbi:MAG: hypothetical protein AABX29_06880, partial [Nanoarchaeota archaeon]